MYINITNNNNNKKKNSSHNKYTSDANEVLTYQMFSFSSSIQSVSRPGWVYDRVETKEGLSPDSDRTVFYKKGLAII